MSCNLTTKVAYILSFYPRGSKLRSFFALRTAVFEIRAICKIFIFGREIWNLKKGPQLAYVLSFHLRGLKMSLALRAIIIKIWQFSTLIKLISYVS